MKECICSSCANLKGIVDDRGAIEEYECEFGFPEDACLNCETNECENEFICAHYISDDEVESSKITCSKCGKELIQVSRDNDEGEIYCADCFLNL